MRRKIVKTGLKILLPTALVAGSARLVATTFLQALDQGALDKGAYWENHHDAVTPLAA